MAKKLPPHLSEEILAKYIPNYDNNTLKVKGKVLNLRNIKKKETEVGDIYEVDFMPQVKIKRWDNDANFSIRMIEDFDPSEADVETNEDKILYKKDTFEARFYLLPPCCLEETPKASEFDVVFYTKPSSNRVEFSIKTKNLLFYKQLPLTPSEIYEGVTRSQEVVNSYAVFHANKAGGIYGTGKAFHIYRPIIYDANDDYTYGDIIINPGRNNETGTMTIIVPQEFLDNAVYPIIVDPTLGYTSLGGSSIGLKNSIESNVYTSPDTGTLSSMSLGVASGSGSGRSIKMGSYIDSTNARSGYTNQITNTSNGWNTSAFNTIDSELAAIAYKLGWKSNVTQMKVAFDSVTPPATYNMTDTFANTFPSTYVPVSATARQWSLYLTYAKTYTFTGDAILSRRITRTYLGEAVLVKTVTRSFTGDCNLVKTVKETFTGDANILNTLTTIFLGRANLKKAIPGSFTGDCNLAETKSYTYTGDANLLKVVLQGYFSDSNLLRVIEDSYTGDAILVKTEEFTFTGDSHLAEIVTGSFTGDANLLSENNVTPFTSDAFLISEVAETYTGDANLEKTEVQTYTGDAQLNTALTYFFYSDANLVGSVDETFTGDAKLEETSESTFTGDAKLARTIATLFTSNANLKRDEVPETVVESPWTAPTGTGSFNDWNNPTNAFTDDSSYADATQANAGSKYQSYHHFGFDIPVTATILGVEVRYDHQESSVNDIDGGVKLRVTKPDTTYGEKDSLIYTIKNTNTLGSNGDTWGLSLTPAEVNSDDFTADIGVYSYITKSMTAFLYFMEVRIIYSIPADFTGDANLLKAVPETFTGQANLGGSGSGQFTGYASLLSTLSGQFTSEASLERIGLGTWTGNANLEKTEEETFLGDARLLGVGEAQFHGNAYLYDSDLKFLYGAWTYGATYGGIIDGAGYYLDAFTGDANLYKSQEQQFLGDASLKTELTGSYTGDANLEKLIADTFTGSSYLGWRVSGSYTGDAKLLIVISNQFTGDSYIDYPSFTGDANFGKLVEETFLGDAALFKEYLGTYTGDANLTGEQATTYTGDSNLIGEVVETFVGDASLKSEEQGVFTGDAIIKTVHTVTFTGDASLLSVILATFTSDTNLISLVAGQFFGDSNLVKTGVTLPFTGDASIKSVEDGTFTSDAYFTVEAVETFAGVVVLESLDQFAGFAGTVDCVSAAGAPGWGLTGMDEFGIELGI